LIDYDDSGACFMSLNYKMGCLLLLSMAQQEVYADIFQCPDPSGVITIQSFPCAEISRSSVDPAVIKRMSAIEFQPEHRLTELADDLERESQYSRRKTA
jgi:trehalose utilization protein